MDLLFLIPIITGISFILAGIYLFLYPPKKINWWYGYRTTTSMKSQDKWDFAQKYSAKVMIIIGVILSLTSVLSFFINLNEGLRVALALFLVIIFAVLIIIITELALKSRFGK